MTLAIKARNVNDAYIATINAMSDAHLVASRNGPTLEYPEPVSVTFTHPRERVLFSPARNINPWLHFFEPLYLLSGRRDVDYLAGIVKQFAQYSDDGKVFNAAYGYRLRWPLDQIEGAIRRLKTDPQDRRTVLQIRVPRDMPYKGKDAACNIAMALKVREGRLNAHVFNRSNDLIWGGPAGGTNHPQFTVLQEYIAGRLGIGLGHYTATTDCMHVYLNAQWEEQKQGYQQVDLYDRGAVKPFPMMTEPEKFDHDLKLAYSYDFVGQAPAAGYESIWFQTVYHPMAQAFVAYKAKDDPLPFVLEVQASDWRNYTVEWLQRRTATKE
jgi:thymidylate synthase